MGKPRLRSPIKAIHNAINGLRVPPICVQPPRTTSFSGGSSLPSLTDMSVELSEKLLVEVGPIISGRFFFMPSTTSSIMEEAKVVGEDDSRAVVLATDDAFSDFRASMEEMIAAQGLRDWPSLQGLLQRYLRLNHESHHKIIVLAFLDLFVRLVASPEGLGCKL